MSAQRCNGGSCGQDATELRSVDRLAAVMLHHVAEVNVGCAIVRRQVMRVCRYCGPNSSQGWRGREACNDEESCQFPSVHMVTPSYISYDARRARLDS